MSKRKKLKSVASGGKRLRSPAEPSTEPQYVVFSFARLESGDYCLSTLDKEHKSALMDAIFKRRQMRWVDLINQPRHGLGSEKIPIGSINAPAPKGFGSNDTVIALRFAGKKPMVGYYLNGVFYVLWLDKDFTLYDHG